MDNRQKLAEEYKAAWVEAKPSVALIVLLAVAGIMMVAIVGCDPSAKKADTPPIHTTPQDPTLTFDPLQFS